MPVNCIGCNIPIHKTKDSQENPDYPPMCCGKCTSTEKLVPNKCHYCGKMGNFQKCAGCNGVKYCDKDCQKSDWPNHRKVCKVIKEYADWFSVWKCFLRYSDFRRANLHKIEPATHFAYEDLRDHLIQYPNVDLFAMNKFTSVISRNSGNDVLWTKFMKRFMTFRMNLVMKNIK